MDVREWLGEDNEIGQDIWKKKYQNNNETFNEWLDRVSGYSEDVGLRRLIKDKKFLPAGRILSNRGIGRNSSLSNCYVLSVDDSIESIFEAARDLARTFSYGGGVGVDLGKLRPEGMKVNNAAKTTSGAVSFMELYNTTTGLIGQNGRRGALMLSMPVNHPDIEQFIQSKLDTEKINNANISVRVDDEFMRSVENDEEYTLYYFCEEAGEQLIKNVPARKIFRMMCEGNWRSAEPGILFWDTIEKQNLLQYDDSFEYAGVNPCFAGNMHLLTVDGYKTFEELCDTEPYIYNIDGRVSKSKVWCSGEKETVIIKTGTEDIICTPDHVFMTSDGDECRAKDLKGKKLMPPIRFTNNFNNRFVKYGFIQGDGQLSRLDSATHAGIDVNIGKKDTDIFDLFSDEEYSEKSDRAIYVRGFKDDLISLGFSKKNLPEREFPDTYHEWSFDEKRSFLRGCYSANGSVIKVGRVAYKTSCKNFAEQLKDTLSEDFDIKAYITTNKAKRVTFYNGEYECKESYDVNIGRIKDIVKFAEMIGFYQQYKKEHLSYILRKKAQYVYDVKPFKKIKVYDFTEPETHWGIVEGCIVHNCAEEPLPEGGACLLGSMNLSKYVKNPFTKEACFDYSHFEIDINIAVNALNEILDEGLPMHPLQIQKDAVEKWREIGLGIMGLGDLFIKMGIRYGSEESVELSENIARTMFYQALLVSERLAEETGSYPAFNKEAINNSDMVRAVGHKVNALKNSQLLTIPPTGTTSTMIGASSGMEPIFAISYTRKTKSLHGRDVEYKVFSPVVREYMEMFGVKDEKDLPDYFVTAKDIPYKERIAVQAAWQKWIDASISSTINLPEETTIEEVEDIYMTAWKAGLKGVTIYRDGCDRSPILDDGNKKEKPSEDPCENEKTVSQFNSSIPVARENIGYRLEGSTYVKRIACGKLYITINRDPEGNLVEVFIDSGKSGGCSANAECLGRFASAAMRNGMAIESIIDTTKGVKCSACTNMKGKSKQIDGLSCGDVLARTIKEEYETLKQLKIENNVFVKSDIENSNKNSGPCLDNCSKCPECGSEIQFTGGCMVCGDCGWSKCD